MVCIDLDEFHKKQNKLNKIFAKQVDNLENHVKELLWRVEKLETAAKND